MDFADDPISNVTVMSPNKENNLSKSESKLVDNSPECADTNNDRLSSDLIDYKEFIKDIYSDFELPADYKLREPMEQITLVHDKEIHRSLPEHDLHCLNCVRHHNPFSILGCHQSSSPSRIILRIWKKEARQVEIRFKNLNVESALINQENWIPVDYRSHWLFEIEFELPKGLEYEKFRTEYDAIYDVRCKYTDTPDEEEWILSGDAYQFGPTVSDFDLNNFQSGHCWHVDNIMGSHIVSVKGLRGVRFTVWAPTAKFASVVGDWNQWDGRTHPMRRRHEFGVWDLFIPDIGAGEKYGYKLHTEVGTDIVKIDPYAQEFENPPAYSSIISSCDDAYKLEKDKFKWTDDEWINTRTRMGINEEDIEHISRQPMSIYEVHLPSWRRGEGDSYLSYSELADPLIAHVLKLNFTHVEFLPVTHHPFEGSWGYQVSGQYSVYSRLGNGDDFKYLINRLHANNIGVFLDMVPAHFCKDDWGLARYDGSPTYEYSDPREGENLGWGTYVYNFGKSEVRSYLLGAIYHWIRRYHIDGIRIDAVSAMIYKNYCREEGEWIPNELGGDANLQAISLLREMNWVVHKTYPGVFMMAEESTSWKGVTDKKDGLGFDAKWDLGWMNDTLTYTTCPTEQRHKKHNKLTFRGLYVGHESWVCPLSHDEVVSGKGSLLDKMAYAGASFDERRATLKAVYGFQASVPGRPLMFQGCEFGQGREWSEKRSIDWHEAEEESRSTIMSWVSDLMGFYKSEKALHAGDSEAWNFKWVVADAQDDNVIAFIRSFGEWNNDILVIINFSRNKFWRYPFGVSHGGRWTCLANSDDWKYGGSMFGTGNNDRIHTTQGGVVGWPYCLWLDLAPHSCQIWKAPQPQIHLNAIKDRFKR